MTIVYCVVYCVTAALLIWLSFKSFRGGLAYLAFFKTELAKPISDYTPFATIIAPCRGLDEGLDANLASLFDQKYPQYEIIFVVDDEDDPAVSVIEKLISANKNGVNARLVYAPKAVRSSQKVENLISAVEKRARISDVLVFVDSDARPETDWLRRLVAPLETDDVGASTGYRWFISPDPNFASELRSAWNASIASALGPNARSNFCWGGSMAIRCSTFDKFQLLLRWNGTVSDDFVVTRTMEENALKIAFVPQALTVSYEHCTLFEMLEFTTRQIKITRTYAPKLWAMSLIGSTLFVGVMLASPMILIFSRENSWLVVVAAFTIFSISMFSIGKSFVRLKAVRLALPQWDNELRRQTFTQLTLFLIAPMVFLYNCIAALFSRRLTWRGTTYELKSASETVIITSK